MATYDKAAFTSTALQNTYDTNAALVAFRADLEAKSGIFAKLKLTDPQQLLEQIDARIAAFENVIIDAAATTVDENKPYDRASLKREFLEEVLSVLALRQYGVVNIDDATADNESVSTTFNVGNFAAHANLLDTNWDIYKKLTTNQQSVLSFYNTFIDSVFAQADKLKSGPVDPATGKDVQTWVVTAITPYTYGGTTFDRVTSILDPSGAKEPDGTIKRLHFVVPEGVDLSKVEKVIETNTAGNPVSFHFVFKEPDLFPGPKGDEIQNVKLLQVDFKKVVNATGGVELEITPVSPLNLQTVNGFRGLSVIEFLYFWNESRIKILKGQLGFKQAITQEIQEDLRQANEALAELEKVANIRNTDEKGNITGETSNETIAMNLLVARASTGNTRLFDETGGSIAHTYGEWQKNRANLKNYIDRKSAQSQDAMLDYQQVLNRYNNALEIMSKLQEKLDNLLKTQLRNL